MGSQIFIETERLFLRQWEKSDEEAYIKMNLDKDVMKFFPATLTEDQSRQHIDRMTEHIQNNGYGLFAVERKEDGSFIGFIGFSHPSFEACFTPCTEIGWRLAKSYWRYGYATEGAKACLGFGFDKLALKDIYSFTSVHNKRSEQVMKNAGMKKLGWFDHPSLEKGHYLQKHVLYKSINPAPPRLFGRKSFAS